MKNLMHIDRRDFLRGGMGFSAGIGFLSGSDIAEGQAKEYQPLTLSIPKRGRIEVSLDGSWLFQPADALRGDNPTELKLDDHQWHRINVPDFWRPIDWWLYSPAGGASSEFVSEEQRRVAKYTFDVWKTQAGWYRHWLEVPAGSKGKRFVLRFSGVASVAEVWWNGHRVGSHIGMFGPFECDVTSYILPGRRNLLTVFVAARKFETQASSEQVDLAVTIEVTREMVSNLAHGGYDLEWVDRNGEIWAPVKLIITEPVKIDDLYFIPRLDGGLVKVTIDNPTAESVKRKLRLRLRDQDTEKIFYEQQEGRLIDLASGEKSELNFDIGNLRPHVWSPDFPHLYLLETLLEENGRVVDRVETVVGFRTFEVKGRRFYLNGEPYFLRGAGTAPYGARPHDKELATKFMKLMHDGNQAVTRFHTTGVSETWASAADRMGVGLSVEGIWPWSLSGNSELPDEEVVRYWTEDQLALFRSLRNHPSILIWTINNEMRFHFNSLPKPHYFDTNTERRLKKWNIVSNAVKMVRVMDASRPIVASSEYARSRVEYEKDLKPNGIDDGDIDDIHLYNGWYGPSGLFVDVQKDIEEIHSETDRPLISQEASTGYPNNDTGYPISRYVYEHYTAQAWLGDYVFDPSNPFLRFHARVTQEWMEKIRRHRSSIAGWMLFSNCNWFKHVTDYQRIEPFPTYYSAKNALQPILVSLESPDRHFLAGQVFKTDVYVVNDDACCRNLTNLNLGWSIQTNSGKRLISGSEKIPDAAYYAQVHRQINFRMPDKLDDPRSNLVLRLQLRSADGVVSDNQYNIVVVDSGWIRFGDPLEISLLGDNGELSAYLESLGVRVKIISSYQEAEGKLIIVGPELNAQKSGGKKKLFQFVESGGKALFLKPDPSQAEMFELPLWRISEKFGTRTFFDNAWNAPAAWGGEFVSIPPKHPVVNGLSLPDDLRWWNSGLVGPTVCEWAFDRPASGKEGKTGYTSLCDYVAPHGYLGSVQDFEKYRGSVVLENNLGKGRMVLSTLRLADDPVARRLVGNLARYVNRSK